MTLIWSPSNAASISVLTHWGRVTHKCVSKLTIIVSNNGLSLGRRQAIIWNNVGILLIGPLGINFSEILIEIYTFSFKKMHLKMSSGKWRPFCLGLNVLKPNRSICPCVLSHTCSSCILCIDNSQPRVSFNKICKAFNFNKPWREYGCIATCPGGIVRKSQVIILNIYLINHRLLIHWAHISIPWTHYLLSWIWLIWKFDLCLTI